ncbi:hypothetical protein [Leptospira santarosai]
MIPIAKEVKLTIVSNPGYKILHVYGAAENEENVSDKFVLNLGELNANNWRIIVAEVSGKGEIYNPISDYVTYSNRIGFCYILVCFKIIKLYFLNIKKKFNIRFDKNLNHKNILFLICEIS